MSSRNKLFLAGILTAGVLSAPASAFDFGRPATPAEIKL